MDRILKSLGAIAAVVAVLMVLAACGGAEYEPTREGQPAPTRSLAGKPLAKFRATRDRRIPVLYGIVSDGIRHGNRHTIEIRRPKIDDLENVGFPARFLGSVRFALRLPTPSPRQLGRRRSRPM